jgi:hypothetical protein
VGDRHGGGAEVAHAVDDQIVDHVGHDRVEAGRRLVEEDDLGFGGDGAGEARRASACRPTARPGKSSPTLGPEPDLRRASRARCRAPWRAPCRALDQAEGDVLPDGSESNSAPPWNSMPNLRISGSRGRREDRPSRRRWIEPASGRSRPRMHLISTDLPVPEPPMTTRISPAWRTVEVDAVEHVLGPEGLFDAARTRSFSSIAHRAKNNSGQDVVGGRIRIEAETTALVVAGRRPARRRASVAVIAAHQGDDEAEHRGLDQAGDHVVELQEVDRCCLSRAGLKPSL